MADQSQHAFSIPFGVFSSQGRIPSPEAGKTALHEHTGVRAGTTIAAGLVTFNDMDSGNFKVWYDEILFLHSAEGEFELDYDGKTYPMKAGDVAWVRAGSTVVYRARGGAATLFYAVNPSDWTLRRPP
jgi:ethanolamine utilization protein EutQ (cupin superfamily)